MSSPTPYICSRCLRAASRLPRQQQLRTSARSYHSRTHLAPASQLQHGTSRNAGAFSRSLRTFSTSRTLLAPAVTPQEATTTPPPPPPPSQSQYATTTVLNPRFDPETKEQMSITLTPRATKRLQQIMTKDANPSLCLRVTVESGGCHGFQYLMSLEDMSKIDEGEDVVFVGSSPDVVIEGEGWREKAQGRPKVVIDEASLELLQGSRVDYTMELIGSQFKIDNPRASSSCGCGTSFDVKI